MFDIEGMDVDDLEDLLFKLDHDPKSVEKMIGLNDDVVGESSSGETKGGPNGPASRSRLGLFQKVLQNHQADSTPTNGVNANGNNKDKGSDKDSGLKLSEKIKRTEGPQLSVVSPLDVLRQQLIYELARKRIKENREKLQMNEQLLKSLGKRSVDPREFEREMTDKRMTENDRTRSSLSSVQMSLSNNRLHRR